MKLAQIIPRIIPVLALLALCGTLAFAQAEASRPVEVGKLSRPSTKAARDTAKAARLAVPNRLNIAEPNTSADGRCAIAHPTIGVVVFPSRAILDEIGAVPLSDLGDRAWMEKYTSGLGVQFLSALPADWQARAAEEVKR